MHAKLVIIEGADKGREVKITKKTFRIGRSTDADLTLADDKVSRNHAEVSVNEKGFYFVRDKQSKNGIFVNGLRVLEHCLSDGDVIQVGQYRLLFQKSEAVERGKVEEIKNPLELSRPHSPEDMEIPGPDSGYFEAVDEEEPTKLISIEEASRDPRSQDLKLKIRALYQSAKTLSHVEDDSTMLKALMNIMIQSIPSKRAIVILAENGMKYLPRFMYSRDGLKLNPSANGLKEILKNFQSRNYSFISKADETASSSQNGTDALSMISAVKASDTLFGFIPTLTARGRNILTPTTIWSCLKL